MRDIAMRHTVATAVLGSEVSGHFRSLLADIKEAMFLSELIDLPKVSRHEKDVRLTFFFSANAWLEAEPVDVEGQQWQQCHRLKLLYVYKDGARVV